MTRSSKHDKSDVSHGTIHPVDTPAVADKDGRMEKLAHIVAQLAVQVSELTIAVAGLKDQVTQLSQQVAQLDQRVVQLDQRVIRLETRIEACATKAELSDAKFKIALWVFGSTFLAQFVASLFRQFGLG